MPLLQDQKRVLRPSWEGTKSNLCPSDPAWHDSKNPFILPGLLRNKSFIAVCCIGASVNGAFLGTIFLSTLLLTDLFNSSSNSVALYLLPGAISLGALAFIGGRLINSWGDHNIIMIGSFLSFWFDQRKCLFVCFFVVWALWWLSFWLHVCWCSAMFPVARLYHFFLL